MAWLIFALSAGGIVVAGAALARSAAAIARGTRLGQVWVGAVLVAGVTSLPELTVDSAAVLRGSPNLATGDLFGSNMANMAILGLVALAHSRVRVIQREALGIALTASVAIMLTGLATLFVVARLEANVAGAFSLGSLALLAVGVGAFVLLPRYREAIVEREEPPPTRTTAGLAGPLLVFIAAGAVIFAAAPFLVEAADDIAEQTGLDDTFVGVLALALATSLPELATSFAAVRMGALDLAVGNLFGSNALNMMVLVWLDALYIEAPLLETVSLSNAAAGLTAMLLMMIGLTDMVLRAERRRLRIDVAALLILVGYALGLLLVWSMGR